MLQYLLNLTATWLLSLLVFELFLKKETYHAYNRIYLLSTFLIGIFLPLWGWNTDSAIITGTVQNPIQQLAAVKQSIAGVSQHSNFSFTWQQFLWYAYIVGVIVSACLLIFDFSKIVVLYQVGNKYKKGRWTVVETVKGHAPFSIFHILFVDSKEQYTTEQWKIILDHEAQHAELQHIIDQLILQLSRIIFWFHPLVYIYNSRLMLLHEYQADKVSGGKPAVYGKFLVEQAMLHTAPRLAHSFNRSPIKTRIIMLSRHSSFFAKTKTILFIPLIFICAVCFSKNQYSNKIEKNGNIATYRGNKFEFSEAGPKDTVIVLDPVTGKEKTLIAQKSPVPLKINGERIYNYNDLEGKKNEMGKPSNNPAGFNKDNIKEYLITNLAGDLKSLLDNDYTMDFNYIVIDKNGKIVYFEYSGVRIYRDPWGDKPEPKKIDKVIQDKIANKVYDILNNAPAHSPATIDGNDVPFYLVENLFINPFTIKNGKVIKL